MAKRHSRLARNTQRFSKNYSKLRRQAIKDEIQTEKEGRLFLDTCDALELVLLELSIRVLELEKKAGIRK